MQGLASNHAIQSTTACEFKGSMMHQQQEQSKQSEINDNRTTTPETTRSEKKPKEIGGPKGPEPTRYGDWEKAGRCIDF